MSSNTKGELGEVNKDLKQVFMSIHMYEQCPKLSRELKMWYMGKLGTNIIMVLDDSQSLHHSDGDCQLPGTGLRVSSTARWKEVSGLGQFRP